MVRHAILYQRLGALMLLLREGRGDSRGFADKQFVEFLELACETKNGEIIAVVGGWVREREEWERRREAR